MTDWLIRPGADDDLVAVARLTERWEREVIAIGMRAEDPGALHARLGALFFVAEVSGEVIGFANGAIVESSPGERAVFPDGARACDLTDLYVAPEHRGAGIGSALVDTVLAAARALGADRALVYSSAVDWRRIAAFYERHGFRMWFVEMYR